MSLGCGSHKIPGRQLPENTPLGLLHFLPWNKREDASGLQSGRGMVGGCRAHAWSLVDHPAWHLGCMQPCRVPPLHVLDTQGFPPALQSDQRGTAHDHGLSTSHAPAPLTHAPPHLPLGQRRQVRTTQAAVRGSGRVSNGGARSPAFCPHLTATSDHTPSGPSAMLTS